MGRDWLLKVMPAWETGRYGAYVLWHVTNAQKGNGFAA
jgi:hypothetical protein